MNTQLAGNQKWGNKKDAYDYPTLENFHPMCTYALTISPISILRSDILTECVANVSCDILPLFCKAEYELRPEISTKSTILHYHGTLKFPNHMEITKFYFYTIQKLKSVCTFTIKPIDDISIWSLYCKKQRLHMKPFVNSFNIRYKLTHSDKSIYIKVKPINNKSDAEKLDGVLPKPITITSFLLKK